MKLIATRIFILAALLVVSQTPQPVQAQLKPEVQAALIKTKLTDALREKRYADVLKLIGELRALNLPLPASMDYFEGLAAAETGDWVLAENRVSAFLNVGDTKNPLFQPALQLYAKIEPEVAAAKEKARTAAEKEIENLISSADYAGAKQAVIRHANAGAIADRNQYFAKIDAAAEAKRQAAEAAKSAAQRREKKFQD